MLEKLFLQVINMTYIGSMVIMFILVARMILKKTPKKYVYILWAVALIRLLLPISFESVLSIIPINARAIPTDVSHQTNPHIDTGIAIIDQSINRSLPVAELGSSINPLQVYLLIGSIIWIIGMMAFLILGIISYSKVQKSIINAKCVESNIYESMQITTPFVLGLVKAKIYLPTFLSGSEKEYIILHEKTHIKRLDHIIRFISYLTLCLHWFNPLVWLAFYLSEKDMEMSCDEAVINQLGYGVKKNYSMSLLKLATGKRTIGIMPLAFGEGTTKGRIKNILKAKKPKTIVGIFLVLMLGLLSVGLLANPQDEAMKKAEEFLMMHSQPDSIQGVKSYFDTMNMKEMADSAAQIKAQYSRFMTDKGFDKAISNRWVPWIEMMNNSDYNVTVESIDLKKSIDASERVNIEYLYSLNVKYADGHEEVISETGIFVMIEEDNQWKVDIFRPDDQNRMLKERLPEEAKSTVLGFIRIDSNRIIVDPIEWITPENTKRMEALGIEEVDMPNGYYIHNAEVEKVEYKVDTNIEYRFIDWGNDFASNDEERFSYSTRDKTEFLEYLNTYADKAAKVPFWITIQDDAVLLVEEQYVP